MKKKLLKILGNLFSIKKEQYYRTVTVLGLKLKFIRYNALNNAFAVSEDVNCLQNDIVDCLDNIIFHYSAFGLSNAGDNILVPALRKSIEKRCGNKYRFMSRNVRKTFTRIEGYMLNKTKGAIIGGGGLFLKDTNPNDVSGWQFPISKDDIEKITVPVVLLGVGYNRFRGQEPFAECFKDNINAMVEKASFVGLRNNGSIRELKKYLREDLKEKLVFHPCATTILSKLYDVSGYKKEDFIALECAFDRVHLRYGKKKEKILNSIAKVTKELSETYRIKYYVHCECDLKMLPYLDKYNVKYEIVKLNGNSSIDRFLETYSKPQLVIGMRGHAQMIPFGCNTPILSIISHDKLKYFLEDIGHTEWGVDVLSDDFEKELLNTSNYILNNKDKIHIEIEEAQNKLYEITMNNIDKTLANF